MTTFAHAILDVADLVVVLCPHCNALHNHPASIGRMTNVPAVCDSSKTYQILLTIKPRSVATAFKRYFYELDRKRVISQKKRDLAKSSSSSESG